MTTVGLVGSGHIGTTVAPARDRPADALAGKIVIDTGNYYPERDGQVPRPDHQPPGPLHDRVSRRSSTTPRRR